MSKKQTLIVLGILILAVVAFSGLPTLWNKTALAILAVAIIFAACRLKSERPPRSAESLGYVEHRHKEIPAEPAIINDSPSVVPTPHEGTMV